MAKCWNVISKPGTQLYGVEWSGVEWKYKYGWTERETEQSRTESDVAALPQGRRVGEVVRQRHGTRLGRGFEPHSSQTSFAPWFGQTPGRTLVRQLRCVAHSMPVPQPTNIYPESSRMKCPQGSPVSGVLANYCSAPLLEMFAREDEQVARPNRTYTKPE